MTSALSTAVVDIDPSEIRTTPAVAWIPRIVFCVTSLLYFTVTFYCSHYKLFWYDELCTLYTSRLPSIADIWVLLSTGFEQLPPLIHLLIRASTGLFGDDPIAARLPSAIGYWVLCLSIFVFLSRRMDRAFAATAALIPVLSGPYFYALEARPYGIVAGACGVALVSWQAAARPGHRTAALVGLASSLCVAISSHYFSVFMVVCLAGGELSRTISSRRVDRPVWFSLAAGSSTLLVFLPLLIPASVSADRGDIWLSGLVLSPSIPKLYSYFSDGSIFLLLLAIGLTLAGSRWRGSAEAGPGDSLELPEGIVATLLVLLPLVLGAMSGIGLSVSPRYVIMTIIGFSVYVAMGLSRLVSPATCRLLFCVGLLFFPWNAYQVCSRYKSNEGQYPLCLRSPVVEQYPGLPIVVVHYNFLSAHYYDRSPSAGRIVFVDFRPQNEAVNARLSDLKKLSKFVDLNIQDVATLLANHDRFLLEISEDDYELVYNLQSEGAMLEIKDHEAGHGLWLFLVTRGPGRPRDNGRVRSDLDCHVPPPLATGVLVAGGYGERILIPSLLPRAVH